VRAAAVEGASVVRGAAGEHRRHGTSYAEAGRQVDHRGEVGLLTRSVTVRGAPTEANPGWGGAIGVADGGVARSQQTALSRMGQRGVSGRSAVTFTGEQDIADSLVAQSSFVDSFQRCVSVYGASGLTVRDNVAHDVEGHCVLLATLAVRDARVTGNLFTLLRPMPEEARDAIEAAPVVASELYPLGEDRHPAGLFWRHPRNVVRGNHAAGGIEGVGFLLDVPGPTLIEATGEEIDARPEPLMVFEDNTAHTQTSIADFDARSQSTGLATGFYYRNGGVNVWPEVEVSGFTAYKCDHAAIDSQENLAVRESAFADNHVVIRQRSRRHILRLLDSIVVGASDNAAPGEAPITERWADEQSPGPSGLLLSSGPFGVDGVVFADFAGAHSRNAGVVLASSTSQLDSFALDVTLVRAVGLSYLNLFASTSFNDYVGALLGEPGSLVSGDTTYAMWAIDDRCTPVSMPGMAQRCPYQLAAGKMIVDRAAGDLRIERPSRPGDGLAGGGDSNVLLELGAVHRLVGSTDFSVFLEFDDIPADWGLIEVPVTGAFGFSGTSRTYNRNFPVAQVASMQELMQSTVSASFDDGQTTLFRLRTGPVTDASRSDEGYWLCTRSDCE